MLVTKSTGIRLISINTYYVKHHEYIQLIYNERCAWMWARPISTLARLHNGLTYKAVLGRNTTTHSIINPWWIATRFNRCPRLNYPFAE